MKISLVSADDFRKAPDSALGVVKSFIPEIKQIGDDDARQFEFRITTGAVDRDDDTINPKGWQLDSFLKNPTVLFGHDYHSLPIGKAISLTQDDKGLRSVVQFTPKGMNPFADTVYDMVKGGFLKATSVGFKPLEYKVSKDESRPYGLDFTKQELLEYSIVPVPSNPEALLGAAAAGINVKMLGDWATKLLSDLQAKDLMEPTPEQIAAAAAEKAATEAKELAEKAAADEAKAAADKEAAEKAAKELAEKSSDPNAALIAAMNKLTAALGKMAETKPEVKVVADPKKELSDEVAMKQIKDRIAAHVTKTTGKLPAEF